MRIIGRCVFKGNFYRCGEEGQRSFECHNDDRNISDKRDTMLNQNEELVNKLEVEDNLFFW